MMHLALVLKKPQPFKIFGTINAALSLIVLVVSGSHASRSRLGFIRVQVNQKRAATHLLISTRPKHKQGVEASQPNTSDLVAG